MISKTILSASALFALAYAQNNNGGNNGGGNNGGNNNAADSTTLSDNAIQTGSFLDGSDGLGAEDGQALSDTSKNNFINFCDGKTLTNGLQITDGSCNGIVMGELPAKADMISSIITFPKNGDTIDENKDFTITVQTQNLEAGSFTNADATYYAAPQTLNGQGQIIGHTHVTVQDLGKSLNPSTPPDATQFAFFKGINDAGNGKGLLSADVAGGLPAGNFRLCTLTAASNHQPVIMPVAQRGSQDDCTKFQVVANGGNNNADADADAAADANAGKANGNGQGGAAAAGQNAGAAQQQGKGQGDDAQAAAAGAGAAQQGKGQGNAAQAAAAGAAQQGKGQGNAAQAAAAGAAQQGKGQGNAAQAAAAGAAQQQGKGQAAAAQGAAAQGQQAQQGKGQAAQGANGGGKQNKRSRLARVATREFVA